MLWQRIVLSNTEINEKSKHQIGKWSKAVNRPLLGEGTKEGIKRIGRDLGKSVLFYSAVGNVN